MQNPSGRGVAHLLLISALCSAMLHNSTAAVENGVPAHLAVTRVTSEGGAAVLVQTHLYHDHGMCCLGVHIETVKQITAFGCCIGVNQLLILILNPTNDILV